MVTWLEKPAINHIFLLQESQFNFLFMSLHSYMSLKQWYDAKAYMKPQIGILHVQKVEQNPFKGHIFLKLEKIMTKFYLCKYSLS